ncbi:MAG: hypothetical protein JO255_16935 [Alphaproteobacteria bacterium]|nr:hypothetical protein [Alphaproteobacteria bacterium]
MTKILIIAAGILGVCVCGAAARADCASELKAVKVKLGEVKDEQRREELLKLADKAEFEQASGRERLCVQAVDHAKLLLLK